MNGMFEKELKAISRRPFTRHLYAFITTAIIAFHVGSLYASTDSIVNKENNVIGSDEVRFVVENAINTGDNRNRPFAVLDKKNAKIYIYSSTGILLAETPVLLGLAVGDHLAPEIGRLPLSKIGPSNRITPAGKYYAVIGKNSHGGEVLWVDYSSRLAIHPVVTNVPAQRRIQRLKSATIEDNRISWGCINVPKTFYKNYISKFFTTSGGMVYILPEVNALSDYTWFRQNQDTTQEQTR